MIPPDPPFSPDDVCFLIHWYSTNHSQSQALDILKSCGVSTTAEAMALPPDQLNTLCCALEGIEWRNRDIPTCIPEKYHHLYRTLQYPFTLLAPDPNKEGIIS